MLNSVVIASALSSCVFVVHVASDLAARAELQWDADAVVLALAHSGVDVARQLATQLDVHIDSIGECGPDVCIVVSNSAGTAQSRAAHG